MLIRVKKVSECVKTPEYQSEGAAGFDLASSIDKLILPGQTTLIPTGLAFEIPSGYEMQIRPRSGTSLRSKLRIPNSPGTIDADFRAEVSVILENTGSKPININQGQRIAQGVISKYSKVDMVVVEELSDTNRGSGGFGSTGQQ